MFYSNSVTVDCPDGYLPITKPKEWSEQNTGFSDSKKAVIFSIEQKFDSTDIQAILTSIIDQLGNLYEIRSVLTLQLARNPVNDFLLGIEDSYFKDLGFLWSKLNYPYRGDKCVKINSKYLFLYQRKQDKPFSK